MRRCLELAAAGAGYVSPNPLVGAVLVDPDGNVLGEGYHARFGDAHAERVAINNALERHDEQALKEATLYVSLEPCSHHGKQPPCSDLVLEKEIPRVVVGMEDPFPKVNGSGIQRLRDAGVDVTVGVREKECQRLNEAFLHHVETGRPLVTLKIAQTLDGRVATSTGDSRWVTGAEARTLVHHWRATIDGVLVGSGTAHADNPRLTVRHVEGRQPQRFVLDRRGELPATLRLFNDDEVHYTTAVVGETGRPAYQKLLEAEGGTVLRSPERDGHLDLAALLDTLGECGGRKGRPLQSLLIEAGPGLATALLRQQLVDRLFVFIAPKVVGEGVPAVGDLGIRKMAGALTFTETHWEAVGDDMLFRGYRRAV